MIGTILICAGIAVILICSAYLIFRVGAWIGRSQGIEQARYFKGLYITAERARQQIVKRRNKLTSKADEVFTSPFQIEIDYPEIIGEDLKHNG